ncbi:MAG TPA: YciI family protein [Acidimicrobiales bacterium]|nr:YciI family protein [Acidimicrobiales bacterium]
MPQYMLSICHDKPYDDLDFNDPEIQRMVASVSALNEELQAKGAWVFGAGLRPVSTATVVRSNGGGISMTDGPFAETKEHIGGFYVIEAADLDAALEWAGKAASACGGFPVEVRPLEGG